MVHLRDACSILIASIRPRGLTRCYAHGLLADAPVNPTIEGDNAMFSMGIRNTSEMTVQFRRTEKVRFPVKTDGQLPSDKCLQHHQLYFFCFCRFMSCEFLVRPAIVTCSSNDAHNGAQELRDFASGTTRCIVVPTRGHIPRAIQLPGIKRTKSNTTSLDDRAVYMLAKKLARRQRYCRETCKAGRKVIPAQIASKLAVYASEPYTIL
jgi:hypothetical protein